MEAQRRYPTPALFVRPAGVEDGAELDVAGAAEEIELSNWAGTGLTTSWRRPGTRLGEKGPRSWSRINPVEGWFDGSGASAAVRLGAAADHVYDGYDRTRQ